MTKPEIDVVIVAYRSEADLPSVLNGLETMSAYPHHLHLFDNAGNKKTLTIAWNDLAAEGNADYIMFLNTDIRLSTDWDARLIEGFERHADAGVILPRPIGHDWVKLVNPSEAVFEDPAIAPPPTADAMKVLAEASKDRRDDYSFGGACNAAFYAVMIRRSTWNSLRGFDERFRFYGQDHNFQRRILSRFGKYSIVVSCAPVWHRCGGSVRKAAENGEVDFNSEMHHCGETMGAIASGKLQEWDILEDRERLGVRMDARYNRMPVFH